MAAKAINRECRLWRGGKLSNQLWRLRYFRGHGVHSPFVYSLKRNIFMSGKLCTREKELFNSLLSCGVATRTATEIANLAEFCNYSTISVDQHQAGDDILFCSKNCLEQQLLSIYDKARVDGTTIVIELPYKRKTVCNAILKDHQGTSIDRLGYIILFNNNLPKQHFKL